MKSRMPLGDFLVAYLRTLGVTHLFGIPGDLVMRLFLRFGRRRGLHIVTMSHEPGVGFAADGYARATGRIGVVCVTYGAGGHNMVNPVAGSFSERVPILVISGGPGEEERKLGTLIHHQAKEIESQLHIYRELTCDARVIDNPATAAEDIDAVVHAMWADRRPGYIEIHRDMVERVDRGPGARDRMERPPARAPLRPAQGARGGARDGGAAQPRARAGGHRRHRVPPLPPHARAAAPGRAQRRAVRHHGAGQGGDSRSTTRTTWACTSARSARAPIRRASTAPTSCSTSARC